MIHYLVTRDESRGIARYLETRGRPLAGSLRILFFDDLHRIRSLEGGVCILSNLDHLTPAQRRIAGQVADRLLQTGPGLKVLNRPDRVLLRHDLLRELHARGFNRFRAVRASAPLDELRFPVFLRAENNHLGALTGLLATPRKVDRAIRRQIVLGYQRSELLAVEFCDTSDAAGIFRKYSAIKVGNRILPRYLNMDPHWVVKFNECRKEHAAEVLDFFERNPHEAFLREIFEIAGVDYGRVDYGILDGRPQVWEINLHPLLVRRRPSSGGGASPKDIHVRKIEEAKSAFHARLIEAFRELDGQGSSGKDVPVDLPGPILRTLKTTAGTRARTQFRAFMTMKRRPLFYARRGLDAVSAAASFLLRPLIKSGFRR